jgi:hypothetical protein
MRGAAVVTVAVMAALVDPAAGRATHAHTTTSEAMVAQARLLRPATAASFSTLPSPVLGGFTRQGWPIVAQMASDGSIARIGIGLDMRCTAGDQFALNDFAIRVPIGARGKVERKITIRAGSGGSSSGPALTGGTDTLSGHMNQDRTTFNGKWDLHLEFVLASGQTDTCDSTSVPFTVRS